MNSTKKEDIDKVKALGHLESCIIASSEDGGAEVFCIWDTYHLYEIPQFGGECRYCGSFGLTEIPNLVDVVRSWT